MIKGKNLNKLFDLIKENPELEIVPIVDSEVVVEDGFSNWLGSWGKSRIDELWVDEERYYLRADDEEELQDYFGELVYLEKYPMQCHIGDEESKEIQLLADVIVRKLPWKKVIVVDIDTP